MNSALRELEENEYLERVRRMDRKGKIIDIEYIVYEVPKSIYLSVNPLVQELPFDPKPSNLKGLKRNPDLPYVDFLDMDNPNIENM